MVPAAERKEISAKRPIAACKQELAVHRARKGKGEQITLKMWTGYLTMFMRIRGTDRNSQPNK